MPLAKAKYDVPLTQGLTEQADARVLRDGGLLTATNVVQNRMGSLEKRPGYTKFLAETRLDTWPHALGIDPYFLRVGKRGSELYTLGRPSESTFNTLRQSARLYSYSPGEDRWIEKNCLPSAQAEKVFSYRNNCSQLDSHFTHTNGLYVHWYVGLESSDIVLNPLFIRVIDPETGAVIMQDRIVVPGIAGEICVLSLENYSVCIYRHSETEIRMVYYHTTTNLFISHSFPLLYDKIGSFSACDVGGGRMALAIGALNEVYQIDGVRLYILDTPPSFAVLYSDSINDVDVHYFSPAVFASWYRVGVAFGGFRDGIYYDTVYTQLYDPDLTNPTGIEEIYHVYSGNIDRLTGIFDDWDTPHVLLQCDVPTRDELAEDDEAIEWVSGVVAIKLTDGGTPNGTTFAPFLKLGSYPFLSSDTCVYVVVNGGTDGRHQWLMRIHGSTFTVSAVLARGTARDPDSSPYSMSLTHVVKLDYGVYLFPSLTAYAVEQNSLSLSYLDLDLYGTDLLKVTTNVDDLNLWSTGQVGSLLLLAGGFVASYDGDRVAELGFLLPPEMGANAVETVAYNDLNPDRSVEEGEMEEGTYLYVAHYEYIDRLGHTHRSALSNIVTCTVPEHTGLEHYTAFLSARSPGLSNHWDRAGEGAKVTLQVYRTLKNQAGPFYRLTNRSNASPSDDSVVITPSSGWVWYLDPNTDATVKALGRGYVYTEGGLLEDQTPPSSRALLVHRSRVWLLSTEDGRKLYFSKTIVPGEAPGFNEALTLRIDDSPDVGVALASIDDKLIIFTPSRIYYVVGDGPDDTGANGAFAGPYLISANEGCRDARSVVSFAGGVFFATKQGLCLLDRGLGVSFPGASVLNTITALTEFQGATHDARRSRLYWATTGSDTGMVMYDYLFNFWARHTVAGIAETIHDVAVVDGLVYYASGYGLFHEEPEYPGFDANDWVGSVVSTPWIRLSEIAGYQRVWRIHITAQAKSRHVLTVDIYTDFDDENIKQSVSFEFMESLDFYYYPPRDERVSVHVSHQKCQAIRIVVRDNDAVVLPPGFGTWIESAGFSLAGITLELGTKQGLVKLPAAMRK